MLLSWSPAVRARSRYALIVAFCLAGCGSRPAAAPPASAASPAPSTPPAARWTLDRSTFDPSADPCDDFYQYVCGGWARTPLPAGRTEAHWSRDQLG